MKTLSMIISNILAALLPVRAELRPIRVKVEHTTPRTQLRRKTK
jgi:hypothetical protein